MNVADRIGLLPGFSQIAGHGFWPTLVVCLIITPGLHQTVAIIGESRWVPMFDHNKQFLSYFPGDIFLGVSVAGMLWLARELAAEDRFYNATWFHLLILAGAVIVAIGMTYLEWKGGVYPTEAIFSPTKLYHNGLLYVGYGYVIVTTLVALVVAGSLNGEFALILLPGLVWVALVAHDNSLGKNHPAQLEQKAKHAHVADWEPIWRMP